MIDHLAIVLPETVLVLFAAVVYVGGAFVKVNRHVWPSLALAALAASAATLPLATAAEGFDALASAVVGDTLAVFAKGFFLLLGLLLVGLSWRQGEDSHAPEFFGSLLLVVAGMMLTACAGELVLLFLGLELISIPTYVLLYLPRDDAQGQEAATKYFFLSILSSALALYGFALLYGVAGVTNLEGIRQILDSSFSTSAVAPSRLGLVALVLVFAGLGFKIAAVPFHFYAPDVYQGTSALLAGLLAVAPKAAGFLALLRVASYSMAGYEAYGTRVALILAAITMTGGNLLGLLQNNVRRLLAYSSIAHAGYMLIGVSVGFWQTLLGPTAALTAADIPGITPTPLTGIQSVLFYLTVYSLATLGAFAVLVYLGRPQREVETIDDLVGLGRRRPIVAMAMAVCLFSLAGIPPLAGFWGKLAVFASALSVRQTVGGPVDPWFVGLAVLGMVNAAIAAVYYLRIVTAMYLREPLGAFKPGGGAPALAAVVLSAVLVVAVGILPRPVMGVARTAGPLPLRVLEVQAAAAPGTPESAVPENVATTDSDFVEQPIVTSGDRD